MAFLQMNKSKEIAGLRDDKTPSSKQAAAADGSVSRLENIRKLKEQAYALIDAAISIETDDAAHADLLVSVKLAKEFYRRGIAKLEAFMSAPLPIEEQ